MRGGGSGTMKSFLIQFAFVLVPKLLSGLASAGIGFVLMRFLDPDRFGVLTLCLSVILLADAILGSAFDLAAVRRGSELLDSGSPASAIAVQRACLALKLGAGLVAAAVVVLCHRYLLTTLFKGEASVGLLVVTGFATAAVLALRSAQLSYQLQKNFRHYGLLDLASNLLKCGGVAALIWWHRVSVGHVMLVFLSAPGMVLLGWVLTHGRPLVFGLPAWADLRSCLHTASWFLLTFSTGALVARIDLWMVARFLSSSSVGIYAAAQMLALILPMLGTYLSVVVSPRVLPLARSGRLLRITYVLQALLLGSAGVMYALAWVLLPELRAVFPVRFAQALPIFLILLPGSLAAMVSFPLTLTTLMFLQPRFLSALDAATVPLILLAYVLVLPRGGLVGAAIVTSLSSVCRALAAQFAALRLVRRSHREYQTLANAGPSLTLEVSRS